MSISSLRFDSRTLCTPQPQHPFTYNNPYRSTPNVVVCAAKPLASPPTKLTAADPLAGRIESLSQVSGVLGCQWGDEGKGKLVDILAQHFEIVARCQVFLLFPPFLFFFLKFLSFSLLNLSFYAANRGLCL
jgi:adenylosuccinate synthase